MKILVNYLIIINLFSFIVFWIDKQKAKQKKWRISEKNLFVLAILGGSIGCISGMYNFRHKTRHPSFYLGMPIILILQITAFYLLYYK